MKESVQAWVELAKRDLEAAKMLLNEEYVANAVLFHCQQAVEKILKALLEESAKDIPRTHSIIKLYGLIPQDKKEKINIESKELAILDEIYIDFRYPSELGIIPNGFPTYERAKSTYDITNGVVENILKVLC